MLKLPADCGLPADVTAMFVADWAVNVTGLPVMVLPGTVGVTVARS